MSMLPVVILVVLASVSGEAFHAKSQVSGATLNISVLQPIDDKRADEIVGWLQAAAENVNLVYGRFPNPSPNIVVIPVQKGFWGRDDAVIYGEVTRRRGETITFYVNPDRPISEFYADWTATHELSHLMLPLLKRRHRWISEGFATYYQNVLMSRAGQYTQERAWTKLVEGFERGRRSSPRLSPNEASANRQRQSTMKIYWSGAAIALLADVELRQRSGGKESLDSVLDGLQRCCLPATREWSGPELFRKLDSMLDEPVFMPLYRRHADTRGFPDVDAVLGDLGVSFDSSSLRLMDNADLTSIRDELTKHR